MHMGSKFDPDKDAANIFKHGLSLVEDEGVLKYWWLFGPSATTASA